MYARPVFGLILLWPMFVCGAEPARQSVDGESTTGSSAGEPNTNVTLRVRLVEVSLTKLKNTGLKDFDLSWPGSLPHDRSAIDRQLGLLVQKSIAKVIRDETIVVAIGSKARLHAGTEFTPGSPSNADADDGEIAFYGTDIVLTPRTQTDGPLAIELLCKQSLPVVLANEPPQRRVHEIATVVELAEDEALILNGEKDKRLEDSVRGPFPQVKAAFGRVTTTVNEVQTFVVVSREPRLADETAATVEMQE